MYTDDSKAMKAKNKGQKLRPKTKAKNKGQILNRIYYL